MKIATILFAYNRPWHTEQVLNALAKNTILPEKLFLFHDGLKKEEHRSEWMKVKELIHQVKFCPIDIIESMENKGLANSIISGVNRVFEDYDAVIVLEDDCVPAYEFMAFMKQAFCEYQSNKQVYSISGYSWPMDVEKDEYDAYFTGRISSWGWGTWKDRWQQYTMDNSLLKQIMSNQEWSENLATWGSDLDLMFNARLKGANDSWAVFWALLVIRNRGICLTPFKSLIKNIGLDGSGVNCGITTKYNVEFENIIHGIFLFPKELEIKEYILRAFCESHASIMGIQKYNHKKSNVILYGVGGCFHKYENVMAKKYNVIALVDIRREGYYAGKKIINPKSIKEYEVDKIIIMLNDFEEIEEVKRLLTKNYNIAEEKIISWMCCI